MDILDSFTDYIQLIITTIAVIFGISAAADIKDVNNELITNIGIPLVAVWIFFDYDIYLGMIAGSLICLFSSKFNSDEKFMATVLLIMTLIKFGYFGFFK